MNTAKLTTPDPIVDRPPAKAKCQELPTSDETMLSLSKPSDAVVDRTKR